jgi:glycosyltransferase involved in cell wall biosynthesis
MKLSILIATIESRFHQFNILLEHLKEQKVEGVEILSYSDNKQISIGNKRQALLNKARGEYVCFIDDDDWVPSTYISKIMEGINNGVDCVGFLVALDGWGHERIICSLSNKWDGWYDNVGGYRFVRCPNHLSVIKKAHCLTIGYPDLRCGEDSDFSIRLKSSGLIKTEHFINEIMYEYRFKFEAGKY